MRMKKLQKTFMTTDKNLMDLKEANQRIHSSISNGMKTKYFGSKVVVGSEPTWGSQ